MTGGEVGMKGIKLCGECADYDWKKHKCKRGKSIEINPRNPFYDDCPLPDVVEVVRCKSCWKRDFDNCPFHEFVGFKPDDDWFCGDGEKEVKQNA